ncbi:unnamed protein product [Heligmosomoides polygyrus]|uniref:Uncharacterized protein n=1 Tax=Heligmosomoides polygyrus TaxID=6339 RepID=A0A183FZ06_HELPZ|nr:unnamed protein product [Heligmosomoides polygyrus]
MEMSVGSSSHAMASGICTDLTEDTEKFFGINDENGYLLVDREKALKRWRDHFAEISAVPHLAIPPTAPTHDPLQKITLEKTEVALKKMAKRLGPTMWRLICGSQSFGTLQSGCEVIYSLTREGSEPYV